MSEPIKFTIVSNPSHIRVVRMEVETFGGRNGLTREQSDQVGLAVNEALANVIKHGYHGCIDQEIHIVLEMVEEADTARRGMKIVIRDFGQQVDPACIKSRNLDEVRPGGLGVHIIKTVMDKVCYRCMPEGGMELTMVKYVTSPQEATR